MQDTCAFDDDTRVMLHAEITDVVRQRIGLNEQFASSFATEILRGLSERMGGKRVYIPTDDRAARNAAIKAAFKGANIDAVCRKFNVSRATVYRIAGEG